MDDVRYLAETIGPREAGSKAEAEAANWIRKQWEELGLEVEVQQFSTVRSFSFAFMVIYALSCAAAFVVRPIHPLAAIIVGAIAAVLFWRESDTLNPVSRWLGGNKSQNVIGRMKAVGKAERRVIVVAHYDSSRSALLFHPQMASGFRQSLLIMAGAMVGVPLFTLMSGRWPVFEYGVIACGVYLLFSLLVLLHRETLGQVVKGANDNGSGVAVLLAAAREMARKRLESTEVWFVATGAEEAGTVGMSHFLTRYGKDVKAADIINLDNLGRGDMKYTVAEGVFSAYPTPCDLVEVVHRVGVELGLDVGPWKYQLLTTDATAALVRGYRAISVMAFGPGGTLPHWHWPTDVPEVVMPGNLDTGERLVVGVLRELDGSR